LFKTARIKISIGYSWIRSPGV